MKMRFFKSLAVAGLILGAVHGFAQAQQATPVQQSGSMLNAATGLYGPAGGATACATVNTTTANNTVTITPTSGNYVYITDVEIDLTGDATGTTGVATMSTTNLTGGPFWSLATLAVATGSGGGGIRNMRSTFPTALKSAAPGVAVTFVPSAQIANQIVCTRVAAYIGP